MDSRIIGQIHDSLVMDVCPEELNTVVSMLHRIMTSDIRKVWDWIIVPLDIEIEASPMNESWYKKKPIEYNRCSCGGNWAFAKKKDDAKIMIYDCVLCGDITESVIN